MFSGFYSPYDDLEPDVVKTNCTKICLDVLKMKIQSLRHKKQNSITGTHHNNFMAQHIIYGTGTFLFKIGRCLNTSRELVVLCTVFKQANAVLV
jgi:hypothetical protein